MSESTSNQTTVTLQTFQFIGIVLPNILLHMHCDVLQKCILLVRTSYFWWNTNEGKTAPENPVPPFTYIAFIHFQSICCINSIIFSLHLLIFSLRSFQSFVHISLYFYISNGKWSLSNHFVNNNNNKLLLLFPPRIQTAYSNLNSTSLTRFIIKYLIYTNCLLLMPSKYLFVLFILAYVGEKTQPWP